MNEFQNSGGEYGPRHQVLAELGRENRRTIVAVMRRISAAILCMLLAICPAAAQFGGWSYLNITGDATTVVKNSPGVLHSITINAPTANEVITIYDSLTGSGSKIGAITIPASSAKPVTVNYDVQFWTGLTVVSATASSDVTIGYR